MLVVVVCVGLIGLWSLVLLFCVVYCVGVSACVSCVCVVVFDLWCAILLV